MYWSHCCVTAVWSVLDRTWKSCVVQYKHLILTGKTSPTCLVFIGNAGCLVVNRKYVYWASRMISLHWIKKTTHPHWDWKSIFLRLKGGASASYFEAFSGKGDYAVAALATTAAPVCAQFKAWLIYEAPNSVNASTNLLTSPDQHHENMEDQHIHPHPPCNMVLFIQNSAEGEQSTANVPRKRFHWDTLLPSRCETAGLDAAQQERRPSTKVQMGKCWDEI